MRLQPTIIPLPVNAGATLYLATEWLALPGIGQLSADVSLSLRLYTGAGVQIAQQDAAPVQPTDTWQPNQTYQIQLALPIAAATKPGAYELALVVYNQQSGEPLPTTGMQPTIERITLGVVQVQAAPTAPEIRSVLARFDYIDLVTAHANATQSQPGSALDVSLIWRPRPNAYQDTYLGVFDLRNAQDEVVQTWTDALGGWDYPSGGWPAGIPVQEGRTLPLDPVLPVGMYNLTLRVVRSQDNQPIAARLGWWPITQAYVSIGGVTVGEKE